MRFRCCLNLTYECNLRCKWCDRGCDILDGRGTAMSLEQVSAFCDQIEAGGHVVERLAVSGGEPLLVPHLMDAVRMIHDRLVRPGLVLRPHVGSNGVLTQPKLPRRWFWRYPPPPYVHADHRPVWWSPVDLGLSRPITACWFSGACGIGYDYRGWSMCALATPLGKLLGIPVHYQGPDPERRVWEVCRHCVYSVSRRTRIDVAARVAAGEIKLPSPTWDAALIRAPHRQYKLRTEWGQKPP